MNYTVKIEVSVHNEGLLYGAAQRKCRSDGMTFADIHKMLYDDAGEIDVAACLVQLFDPGVSPDGCQIEESTAEFISE